MKMNDYYFKRIFECSKIPRILWITALILSPYLLLGQGQTYTIKGTIKDKADPLPGASILIEGTTTGTISDMNGNYELNVTTDQRTVSVAFSSIGYTRQIQQIPLEGQETITLDVVLEEDITQLDEILVVGSTLRSNKRELGNSISSVSTKSLENSGSSNLFSALQGKVPGAQITQNSGDPAGSGCKISTRKF